jgi:uncharacterized protein (DUF952 family)
MRPTFHLSPAERWAAADSSVPYEAPSLASEGFIHCTDGEAALIATADRHYASDPRPFVVLTVDLDAAGSSWRIEDAVGIYPHVYGPIDRSAILEVRPMTRTADGRFTAIGARAHGDDNVGHDPSA